ncbi:MAG: orotidine 5'-phosphate decarboxylase [Planctomycetes bacterium]|nr:orotidine 5'-phosphate decarboxylase [Planctomycetota bacterium]
MQRNVSSEIATVNGPFPVLQVALDFLETERAIKLGAEAVKGGADWIEIGTPLIKSEGLEAVRTSRAAFPNHVIIADLKTMDAGRIEVEAAAKAGASICVCLAAASDATIVQCVEAGAKYGVKIYCDTIGLHNPAERAKEVEKLGVDFIGVHLPVDEQMQGKDPYERLRAVASAVSIPVAVAGGVNSETAASMVEAGASIVIVGGAIHKAPDAVEAAANIKKAITDRMVIETEHFKRGGESQIREILMKVSASNLSDALHHQPGLRGIFCRTPGKRMVGPATTVRTAPGDWNKVVQAIDVAGEGGVVVADCGGVMPAVWGELATQTAKRLGLAGAVIDGAIRDTDVATDLGFPLFSAHVCPDAGDPKGFGEIGGQIMVGGQVVRSGDWIIGDDDGVMVLPKEKAVEYANRALDILEGENRLRAEILGGSTLSKVANLSKWEKK